MSSERRFGFGGSRGAEIDFNRARGQTRDADTVAVELIGRDREPGTSPIFARRRQITHGDNDSFDTKYAHDLNPWSEAIVT